MVIINIEGATKQEFLNYLNPEFFGIHMVAIVTSHTRSLRYPTQQDFIHARTLAIYMCHTRFQILKNPPEYTMRNRVQSGRNTKNNTHAHLLGIASHLHEFHLVPSQNFTPYNRQSVFSGTQCTLPKTTRNNTIFLFQKV